ncbi:DUF5686 and carboxypeptidase regulatory-like domain-containing protein [Mucilaginibacter sp. HMF5004]|uniref:DUF5686 and carboxypeptidase regulatory-like domain-containing protein n=1 Tax=Mucilaginibacter rivuli TaxID=2857527 RepID=UPI001C5E0CC3|nr:DUF5686 and carboxypeptidase regulatory-like domain-containing protein [Mucilaginibacter rivuli]MBW4891000.1 DUF5686 and carboxypeptidase regulatory-like domain-containing protein [Mucilaginibacter rivuli]
MKPTLTFFAFLFFCFKLSAQTVTVSGAITDQYKNPVPFATIYVKNTTKGTSANSDGKYQLQLSPGEYEILYRAIGFRQESHKVTVKTDQKIDVTLAAEAYQLKNVNITANGEDPAYAIIRKTIKKRPYYLKEVNAYSCGVYIKGLQKLLAAPKKFLGADIDKVARENGLDSNRRGIIYLSESQSKFTFMQPDLVHEEMISSKVSGRNNAFSFNRASDINTNFYESIQNWEGVSTRPLISPIGANAMFYYKYKLLGTTVENGETINKIEVIPRRGYDPVFEGVIYILDGSWRIYGVDLYITKKAGINFVDTVKINQQFYPVNKSVWMPASVKFDFTGGFFGFRFGGYFIALYKNYDLNPVISRKEFNEVLRITKEVNKKDSTYWDTIRPIPLTLEEQTDYAKKEILAKKRESKPYQDSIDRVNNKLKATSLLFGSGYNHNNRYDKEYYHFNSLLGSMSFNTVEGFVIDYGASFVKQIDSLNNRFLRLDAKLRYGFASQKVHGSIGGNLPLGLYNLGFRVGSDVLDINNQNAFGRLQNTLYSLKERMNFEKFYDKQFAQISLGHRITGGWIASISAELSKRQWLANTTSFAFQKDGEYTSNNPFKPYSDEPLFGTSNAFKLGLRTTYDFSNKYQTMPNGRRYYPSKYPTLGLSYVMGVKGVFGSDIDYSQLSVDLAKSDIGMGLYGKTSFYINAGAFFNVNSIYFIDYKHFAGNQLQLYEPGINHFLLLPYYKYSTADKYFEGHLEHNFSGFLMNKIPLIRKLKLQEIVDVNYLSTPGLHNYTELGFGLQYLFIRAMYCISYDNGFKAGTGFRFYLGSGSPQRRR